MDNWRKSSYSGEGDGNSCVEITNAPTHPGVGDTKTSSRVGRILPASALIGHPAVSTSRDPLVNGLPASTR